MNGNAPKSLFLKAAGLWERSSVKGGQYLTGRLGGVKVLVLENRDRKTDDEPSHHLFFVEALNRQQAGQKRGRRQDLPPSLERNKTQCPAPASSRIACHERIEHEPETRFLRRILRAGGDAGERWY
jgi:hypothetical protein